MQQIFDGASNRRAIRTDGSYGTRCDGFGSLGHAAEEDHRLSQRRCLLLNAARVGQDRDARLHETHEVGVADRLEQVYARMISENPLYRFTHLWIWVHWEDSAQVLVALHEIRDRSTDLVHRDSEILPAVRSHQKESVGGRRDRKRPVVSCDP